MTEELKELKRLNRKINRLLIQNEHIWDEIVDFFDVDNRENDISNEEFEMISAISDVYQNVLFGKILVKHSTIASFKWLETDVGIDMSKKKWKMV